MANVFEIKLNERETDAMLKRNRKEMTCVCGWVSACSALQTPLHLGYGNVNRFENTLPLINYFAYDAGTKGTFWSQL